MCLVVNELKTARAKRTKKRSRLWYKVVTMRGRWELNSLNSPHFYHQWSPGFNASTRHTADIYEGPGFGLLRGIHVCTTKRLAKQIASNDNLRIILTVRCHKKDLVAVGNEDALYTRVFLSKREYQRAMKKAEKRFG
jgi:hypothetical protein